MKCRPNENDNLFEINFLLLFLVLHLNFYAWKLKQTFANRAISFQLQLNAWAQRITSECELRQRLNKPDSNRRESTRNERCMKERIGALANYVNYFIFSCNKIWIDSNQVCVGRCWWRWWWCDEFILLILVLLCRDAIFSLFAFRFYFFFFLFNWTYALWCIQMCVLLDDCSISFIEVAVQVNLVSFQLLSAMNTFDWI